MKRNEIIVGALYSNGKGRIRKVIDMGPQYKLYEGQSCTENLLYEVINDGSKKNRTAGERGNMTIAAFAAWAKEKLEAE